MKPLRLGFLCDHNPYDRNAFSGTPFFMRAALERQPQVRLRVLGGHVRPWSNPLLLRLQARLPWLRGGRVPVPVGAADLEGLDAVIAPVASARLDRCDLGGRVPVLFVSDATPQFLRDVYNHEIPAECDTREARVLAGLRHAVYSSAYMRDRALAEFPALSPERAHAIPFGLNFDTEPALSMPACPRPGQDRIELLFVGQNWARKGGALAHDCLRMFRARNIPAHLTLIGSDSPEARGDADVTPLGFLNKSLSGDLARLHQAFAQAHVFILPTRADCTPMVVAEANAHGCPVLISDVGGVGALIHAGVNGRMLPLDAGPEVWADAVLALLADPQAYAALRRSSRAHALSRLTWDAWARDIVALLAADRGAGQETRGLGGR